ncbi:hypothetical protein [Kitasatospora purpeofusca]|uniref:hypothetical protein n=1 Tax=Kitasatospora purpeofusca TaxID=67352 RepID=UPI0037FFAD68
MGGARRELRFVARRSQDAFAGFRPYREATAKWAAGRRGGSTFTSLEDAVERGYLLVGSVEQVIEKIHRYDEAFGNEVVGVGADLLTEGAQREQLELFAGEVAPVVRRELPSRRP